MYLYWQDVEKICRVTYICVLVIYTVTPVSDSTPTITPGSMLSPMSQTPASTTRQPKIQPDYSAVSYTIILSYMSTTVDILCFV